VITGTGSRDEADFRRRRHHRTDPVEHGAAAQDQTIRNLKKVENFQKRAKWCFPQFFLSTNYISRIFLAKSFRNFPAKIFRNFPAKSFRNFLAKSFRK
jgi:hypothetical protein